MNKKVEEINKLEGECKQLEQIIEDKEAEIENMRDNRRPGELSYKDIMRKLKHADEKKYKQLVNDLPKLTEDHEDPEWYKRDMLELLEGKQPDDKSLGGLKAKLERYTEERAMLAV